jgi:hypothetical protein
MFLTQPTLKGEKGSLLVKKGQASLLLRPHWLGYRVVPHYYFHVIFTDTTLVGVGYPCQVVKSCFPTQASLTPS